MNKIYLKPEMEVVEINSPAVLASISGPQFGEESKGGDDADAKFSGGNNWDDQEE